MEFLNNWTELKQYLIAGGVAVIVAGALLFIKRLVWSRFLRWAKTSDRPWDEIVLRELRGPLNAVLFLVSFSFGLQLTPAEFRNHPALPVATKLLLVVALVWMMNRTLTVVMKYWRPVKSINASTRSLILMLMRTVLFSLTLLVLLDILGVSITPFLASLGVGSIAVALALQDTLANFFSGVYILIDKPVRPGDSVKVEGTSVEGIVKEIGWRSTHIEASTGSVFVVPNSKLSSSILINYSFPGEDTGLVVTVGVGYESDLSHVEKVISEVAAEVMRQAPGGRTDFTPLVRFHTFNSSSIDLNVTLRVNGFPDIGLVRSEFVKAVHARFQKENITIPYPQQVVHNAKSE